MGSYGAHSCRDGTSERTSALADRRPEAAGPISTKADIRLIDYVPPSQGQLAKVQDLRLGTAVSTLLAKVIASPLWLPPDRRKLIITKIAGTL